MAWQPSLNSALLNPFFTFYNMKKKLLALAFAASPLAVFAEGEGTGVTIPGLSSAVDQAEGIASALAGDLVPAAVTIVFAFAGILGVFAVWKLLKRGIRGA